MLAGTHASLIAHATDIIRRRGYSGFSYADLAAAVGIRKASIHHHFPTKEDLGSEVVWLRSREIQSQLEDVDRTIADAVERVLALADIYREGLVEGLGCLCGVLASEYAILPSRVQDGVRHSLEFQLSWIEQTLRRGSEAGQLRPDIEPSREAKTLLAGMEGAVLVALPLQDPDIFDRAVEGLVLRLRNAQATVPQQG